jgi:P4 family phage/plasmid primase-like protien
MNARLRADDPVAEFRAAMLACGTTPPASIIGDGKLHRFSTSSDSADEAGWYVLHLDYLPAGAFGDWRTGLDERWCAKRERTMSATDEARIAIVKANREQDEQRRYNDAAEKSAAIWNAAAPASADHPYLVAKGIQPHGLRVDSNGDLIVPVKSGNQWMSLQRIAANGEKRFQYGGKIAAGYFPIGTPQEAEQRGLIAIAEGVATAATIYESTGIPTIAAFSANNLLLVAQSMGNKYREVQMLICADDDYKTPGNPGLTKARGAARAVDAIVAVPSFAANRPEGATDFNDMRKAYGATAVKACIERALAPPTAETATALPHTDPQSEPAAKISKPAPTPPPQDRDRADDTLKVSRISNIDVQPIEISDSDIANARRLAARHGKDLKFTPERGWYVWDGRRWALDDKCIQAQARAKETAIAIFDEIREAPDRDARMRHAKHSQSKNSVEAMIWLTRSEPDIPVRLTDFDKDGWLLNVGNGTIDLRTGQLRPHAREDLISNLVEVNFDLAADCDQWDAFLWRVTDRNDELYAYLRRLVGYLLVGDVSDQSLHFLYGLGNNGKSVFCEVLMRLMGEYAVTVSPDLIMLKRHGGIPNDVARLRGVRAALMNETSQGARFDEAKLKDLTGGDTLTARFLHQEFFDFSPTHRIIIRGNHKPAINGTDEGIWRRLRLVPFTVTIPEEERDPHLLEALEAELPGILNWALQGCREWQAEGLKPPPIITDAVRAYREESDTLGCFIGEVCQVRKLAQVKSSALYKRYQEFAEAAGERWIPSKDLPHEMQRRGFTWKRTKAGGIYEGLELNFSSIDDASGDGR